MKMKNIILAMLVSCFFFIGCNKNNDNETTETPLFTEYSLASTSCQWINLAYPLDGELIVINSNEELGNYISCSDKNYPKIDFSKYTLLLADGVSTAQPVQILDSDLLQENPNKYTLKLTLFPGIFAAPSPWYFGFLASKIVDNATIVLDVEFFSEIFLND